MNSSSPLIFKLPTKTDQPENFIKFIYYKPCIARNYKYVKLKLLEPFNYQIKFVILLTVNHTILIMLVQRIKY